MDRMIVKSMLFIEFSYMRYVVLLPTQGEEFGNLLPTVESLRLLLTWHGVVLNKTLMQRLTSASISHSVFLKTVLTLMMSSLFQSPILIVTITE